MLFVNAPCDGLGVSAAETPCTAAAKPWILTATILASSMAFIDSTVVNVALPALQAAFHGTVIDVQWVVESYGLFLAALILIGGLLGDLFGRRRIFLAGVTLFTAASVVCGIAANIRELIFARSIQGVGAAFLIPGSLAIISTSFDEKSRGRAIGTWSGFTALTMAFGPVLGGWLVEYASWRWVFFINVPLAVAIFTISLWRIPESRSVNPRRVDWLGAILATVGLFGLVNGLIESNNVGWRNPLVFGSLAIGLGCLVTLAFVEGRTAEPMIPPGLLRNSSFSGANLLTLFLYAAIGIFFFLFPMNLIQVQQYSSTATGAAILPFVLLIFLLSRWSGGLVARYGPRLPLIAGPLIVALGFVLFAVPSTAVNYWKAFFLPVIVLGLGMAVTVPPLTTVVMNSVDQNRVGTASGINNAVARLASVLAIAVLGIVMVYAFRSRLDHALGHLSLPSGVLHELHGHENQLAGLQPPVNVDPGTSAEIKKFIREAFVVGFREVMLICATLSVASAAITWIMIPKEPLPPAP